MRDLIFFFFIIASVILIMRRPAIGTSLCIWSAYFAPTGFVFGWSQSIRYNLIVTFFTLLSLLFSKTKFSFKHNSILTTIVLFFFIIGLISYLLSDNNKIILDIEFDVFWKTIFIYFLICLTVKNIQDVRIILIAIILSISYYSILEGARYIVTLGSHLITGPDDSKVVDRNDFALVLNMSLPIQFYFYSRLNNTNLKYALLTTISFTILCILGSNSRGGLIGLTVFLLILILQSKNKIRNFALAFLISISVTSMMPSQWGERMNTLSNAEEDHSFIGRVQAWKQAVLMANDNPFFGAGFKAGQSNTYWYLYEDRFSEFDYIINTSIVRFNSPKAAHSIYFQVLGDLGYLGLFTFLLLLTYTMKTMLKISKFNTIDNEYAFLFKLLFYSIIVYCAAGAALSLPYLDFLMLLIGITSCVWGIINEK